MKVKIKISLLDRLINQWICKKKFFYLSFLFLDIKSISSNTCTKRNGILLMVRRKWNLSKFQSRKYRFDIFEKRKKKKERKRWNVLIKKRRIIDGSAMKWRSRYTLEWWLVPDWFETAYLCHRTASSPRRLTAMLWFDYCPLSWRVRSLHRICIRVVYFYFRTLPAEILVYIVTGSCINLFFGDGIK